MNFVDTYREVKKVKGFSGREIIRNATVDALSFFEVFRETEEIVKRPRIQFLYFHHFFKDEIENLKDLIKYLSANFVFISYSDAVNKILNQTIDRSYIVFSADDGFKNNLEAAKVFNEFGIKACFFINPNLINVKDKNEIENICANRLNFPMVEFLSWNDVDKLMRFDHEVGSHTMNHINISKSDNAIIVEDMNSSYENLTRKCGIVKHFAFPYGRFYHFNDFGRAACFNAGFSSCASAERGCHINNITKLNKIDLCIRRDHIKLEWKIRQINYFLNNNSRKSNSLNNLFKYD